MMRDLLFGASKGCTKLYFPIAKAEDFYKGNSWSYRAIQADSLSNIEVGIHQTFRGKALILEVPKD